MKKMQKYLRDRKFKGGRKKPYVDVELTSFFPKKGRFIFRGDIFTYKDVEFIATKKGGFPVAKGLEKFAISANSLAHSEPTEEELKVLDKAMRSGYLLNTTD